MDAIDVKILACLQEDATMAVSEIAAQVGLTTSPCWNRIQKLESDGVITARVALLDPARLNLAATVFVAVRTNQHSSDWLNKFAEVVAEFPEVVEFYRLSGEIDYLLRVVVPDIAAYDRFYRRLIDKVDLADLSSSFAMERIKYTTALPLDYVDAGRS
jgi:Lrp/AsnC family transcriptional regulator